MSALLASLLQSWTGTAENGPQTDAWEHIALQRIRSSSSRAESDDGQHFRVGEGRKMKFSHSLQFNSVPEWANKYIAYSNLKKIIYQIEKDIHNLTALDEYHDDTDVESRGLLQQAADDEDRILSHGNLPDQSVARMPAERIFAAALDKELDKIVDFYSSKEKELLGELSELSEEVAEAESAEFNDDAETGYDWRYQDGAASSNTGGHHHQQSHTSIGHIFGAKGKSRQRSDSKSRADAAGLYIEGTSSLHRTNSNLTRSKSKRNRTVSETSADQGAPTQPSMDGAGGPDGHHGLKRPYALSAKEAQDMISEAELGNDVEEDQENTAEAQPLPASALWTSNSDFAIDTRIRLKKMVIDIFVSLSELRAYVKLNETGFTKACKKFDKIAGVEVAQAHGTIEDSGHGMKDRYLDRVVRKTYPFHEDTRQRLDGAIDMLKEIYAKIVTGNDLEVAQRELKTHLREHIVWERNTVWREMIAIERKAQSVGLMGPLGGHRDHQDDGPIGKGDQIEVKTPVGRVKIPKWLNGRLLCLIVALTSFVALLIVPIFARPEEQNCLALLVFVSTMWASEVIPLFVTSMIIPLLVVILRVVTDGDPGNIRLSAPAATRYIFSTMFSPVIMLLLGGFAIAAAMSKYDIAKRMAVTVLSRAGTRPSIVLLANMGVATFASMWISNVAAPVLCFSLIQPILRNLPPGSPFAKCLILGIALASNLGGMASPIASPQNVIALQNMDPAPGWLEWFWIAIPVCIFSILLIWLLLLWSYNPGKGTVIHPIRATKDKFTSVQWFVSGVTIVTIILWFFGHQLEPYVGDMGVIAILPLLAFFGTGVLTKEDFNNFLWTVIMLAMGGIALGKAVQSSGLLASVVGEIEHLTHGLGIWGILIVFAALTLVIATLISHSVTALLLLPVVAEVGNSLPETHARLLVMGTALMCSSAMGLPVSGFPNMNAIMLEDEVGSRYLSVKDFLKNGIPASLLAMGVVVTIGYAMMVFLGW